MKKVIFIFLILMADILALMGQEVAPFQLQDQKGIKLSSKNLPLLTGKTWTTYKQYYVNKEEASVFTGSFMAFKFVADGAFNGTAGNRALSGSWTLQKKRLLNLAINEQSAIDQEVKIGGAYSVYKLTENELVLVKNLTSDLSLRIVYYCKGTKTSVLAERPNVAAAAPISQADKKTFEEARKKREQEALIQEINTEAQLRGIKVKEKLQTLDTKALQGVKNQILAGTYGKKKTKT